MQWDAYLVEGELPLHVDQQPGKEQRWQRVRLPIAAEHALPLCRPKPGHNEQSVGEPAVAEEVVGGVAGGQERMQLRVQCCHHLPQRPQLPVHAAAAVQHWRLVRN